MKIRAIKVFETGNRHAIQGEDERWYSFYGSDVWPKNDEGQPLKGKLIQNEEYEIEYEESSKIDPKTKEPYRNITKIERRTFKESGKSEEASPLNEEVSPTGERALVPTKEKTKSPVKKEEATVENQISALVPTAGTLKVNKEDQEFLLKDIPDEDVEIRPDGLIYAPWEVYATRLNKIFGLAWSSIPASFKPSQVGEYILWGFSLIIQGKFAGYSIGQQEYHANNPKMTWGDACEGAKSNALMRLCKGLGIGLNLWRPSFIRDWKEKYAESYYDEKKKKTLWRRRGQKGTKGNKLPDIVKAEVIGKDYCDTKPRLTTTKPCDKEIWEEIKDLVKKVAKQYGKKEGDIVKTLSKTYKIGKDGKIKRDEISVEKAIKIKKYLEGQL